MKGEGKGEESVSEKSARGRTKLLQTFSSRGRRSRNKVSVGEPADGSEIGEDVFGVLIWEK